MKKYLAFIIGIILSFSLGTYYQSTKTVAVGSAMTGSTWFLNTSSQIQAAVASWGLRIPSLSSSGDCLVTDANGVVSTSTCGGGGSSKWTDEGTIIYPTTLESIRVPFIEASSTSATSTLPNLKLNNITGIASAGVDVDSSNGTHIANFGVGNSANSLFYGGVNIDGQTRIATSISGLIKATSGILSAAVSGTDYVATTTGDWIGTFDGQEGSYYLARANHTGTQSSTTITGLGTLAGLSSVDISANTNLAGDSEIVLTNDTLSIASTIARDSELHSAVTLSGALDYITLVGQDIVRGAIDLATDITGALGIANGGLGAAYTDPNADQLMFWDDSVGAIKSIATLAGITISGTTLTINDVTCTDCLGPTEITDSYLLNNGDVGTGVYDFGGTTSFEITNGTNPTVDTTGEIALDTTGNQLIVATSTTAAVVPLTDVRIWATTIASTSPRFIDAGLYPVPTMIDGYTITRIQCHVTSGTSKVIAIEDASGNSSEDITCATTNTTDDGSITNPTYTASELSYIDFGATTGAVDYISISVFGNWTRE